MTFKYLFLATFLFPFSRGSTRKFWSRHLHTSVIAGDWIYIDGGDVAHGGDTPLRGGKFERENTTYGLDLSKDWTNSSLNLIQTERPSDSPSLNREVLWYDNEHNTIYCFGGYMSPATSYLTGLDPPPDSIWGFRPNGEGSGVWYEVLGPISTPFPSDIHRISGGVSASDGSSAYYLGGYGSRRSSPGLHDLPQSGLSLGLLTFNFDSLTLTNSTDYGYVTSQSPGAMINIPSYGDNGVLVTFPEDLYSDDDTRPIVGFNNITLYDKKSRKWYSQAALGDIPQPRFGFCAVGVKGNEIPYFEIFIHGGIINNVLGPEYNANSDQVYILSLPSFRWFRANYTSANPRSAHTCHATNSSQMIMIGGINPAYHAGFAGDNTSYSGPSDPWPQGIGVFDMTALKFKESYQAKAGPYETPDIIKEYHSKDGNKYPPSWTSVAVKEIFEGKSNEPSNLTNRTTSNSTVQSSPSSSSISTSPSISTSLSRLSHGVVAGIVVGCATAIVLGAVGATFLVKHRSRSMNPNEPASLSSCESPLEELPAERRAQEIPSSDQDRSELPGTSRRYPIELSTNEPTVTEMSIQNYRSRV